MNWAALSLWRASLEAETPRRLTVTAPPVTRHVNVREVEVNGQKRKMYEVAEEKTYGARIGQSLSAEMVRLLGHDEGYGLAFPVRRALAELDRYCRRRHRTWPDHAQRPVCSEIAYAVIRDRYSIRWAAEQSGVSWVRADALLTMAGRYMREAQERWVWGSE